MRPFPWLASKIPKPFVLIRCKINPE
jgi:hypothetical protein